MPQTPSDLFMEKRIEQKTTIYLGTKKYESSWCRIFKVPHAQSEDATHFEFKPKGARTLRAYIEDVRPCTVIVKGWGHPEFDNLIRSIAEAPSIEIAPGFSVQSVSFTYRRGERPARSKYEIEFEDYIAGLKPDRILFDTRGAVVKKN